MSYRMLVRLRQKDGNPDWYILGAVVVEEVVIIIIKITAPEILIASLGSKYRPFQLVKPLLLLTESLNSFHL